MRQLVMVSDAFDGADNMRGLSLVRLVGSLLGLIEFRTPAGGRLAGEAASV